MTLKKELIGMNILDILFFRIKEKDYKQFYDIYDEKIG